MTLTFEFRTEKLKQPWRTIASLDMSEELKWRQTKQAYYEASFMKERIQGNPLQHYYKHNERFIHVIEKQVERTIAGMYKSVLFIFTTPGGIVLSISGPQHLVQSLDYNHNLGPGSIFTMQNAGLNSISISIELKEWVFLSGPEHDFKLFKDWNCFSSPVRQNGEIIGYLDMSFSIQEDHLLMAPLFELTIKNIEEELGKCDQRKLVYEQFESYQLSPREKEIGAMWVQNYSALRIASELGITEGTVRNVIKKIYKKTGASDKGHFIRKFVSNYSLGFIHPVFLDAFPQVLYYIS